MVAPTPIGQRASRAALSPPARKIEEALPAEKRDDFRDLLKHAREASFARGAILGGLLMLFAGVAMTLAITTALFDPISKSAGQNVATGAAIAAQDGR